MLDHAVLQSVAKQLLNNTKIDLDGKISRVTRTSSQHLRTTTFETDGRQFQAIEQNATKPSRWGQLAREGHQVIQFKDVQTNRFSCASAWLPALPLLSSYLLPCPWVPKHRKLTPTASPNSNSRSPTPKAPLTIAGC